VANGANGALWEKIAGDIRGSITSGQIPPGERLPSEEKIRAAYRVSRETVRRALDHLTGEGLVTSGKGRGRRVREHHTYTFHASQSESGERCDQRRTVGVDAWVADARDQGCAPGQAITVAIVEAPREIAGRLGLSPGTSLVVRRRVRSLNGKPHNLADTFYPLDIAEGTPIMLPGDVAEGVINLMRDLGHVQVRYTDELECRMPDPEQARLTQIPAGVPVLVQTRTGHTAERAVRVAVTVWPGDRTRLVYELPA
jgi:GntR family transcriptional regulator